MRRTRILAIDGGGIRGIVPAKILGTFEDLACAPISKLFDLIIGTSTGGLIALALTTPGTDPTSPKYSADDLVKLYLEQGQVIFRPSLWRRLLPVRRAPYPSANIESVLHRFFGDAALSQSLTDVAVTAYNLEERHPYLFSAQRAKRLDRQGRHPEDFYLRDVARATSAAPTYFRPACIYPIAHQNDSAHRKVMIDGGVFANNPAFSGVVEGLKAANAGELGSFVLVSIGAGTQVKQFMYEDASKWWLFQWASHILEIVLDGASDHVDERLKSLLSRGNYFRFQVNLDSSTDALDDASPDNLMQLLALATRLTQTREGEIQGLVNELRSPATKPTRLLDLASSSSAGQNASDDIVAISENVLKAFERTYAPFTDQIVHQLSELRQVSSDWGSGQVVVSGLDYHDMLIDIYEHARRSIHATVVPEFIRDIWSPQLKSKVFGAHRKSGAEVRRIFIFNNRREVTQNLFLEMRLHHEAGFTVMAYFDEEDPAFQFSPDLAKSFTIVDEGDVIGVVELIDPDRPRCRWFFYDEHRRRFFVDIYEQLTAASIGWSEIEAQFSSLAIDESV